MISRQLIIAGFCLLFGIIGIQTTLYWILLIITFILGFVIHLIVHRPEWLKASQIQSTIKTAYNKRKLITHIGDIDTDSSLRTNDRVPLTGIPVIDEPLSEAIDLFVRDYIEVWYKTQVSSDESFIRDVKNGIYITIQHLAERLREIDWLDFCTGTVVDSFATHVRLYRKAKERMRLEQSTDVAACFFDLEAEYERGICRYEVCTDKDKEKEFLRDIVEVLIYILLPANEFRCVPARMILREVVVNLGLIPFIDMYTDPDAINQLIIRMCHQFPLTIDNFLLVARTTDSTAELSTLAERISIEINRWRSKDTGGENDAEIRATLNSYQYLKRLLSERLEKQAQIPILDDEEILQKVTYHDLPLTEILNNCNGLDYFLKFLQTIDAAGYANFYLNAEAFRCAGLSVQQQNTNGTHEQHQANLEILRHMAYDLIEQYFLPTGTFKLQMDENLIQKTLKILRTESMNETLLDELQSKVFEILSSDKYYGQFKTTSQYLKVLSEIDLTDSLNDNSDNVSLSSNNSNEILADYTEQQHNFNYPPPSGSTTSITNASFVPDMLENINNYSITTEINDSGVCCEKGEKYAIYVISVSCKPLHVHGNNIDDQRREWITYRRYSEFHDFDIVIKKRYADLREFLHLPNKSLINNTSPEVRSKRQKELNDYLSTLTKTKVLHSHPQIGELVLKFLRNQQWKQEQTEFVRKMDTIVNPFKQASIGIARGVSKLGDGLTIVSDSVVENAGKFFRAQQNNNNRTNIHLTRDMQTFPIVEETQVENAKNIPLRVLLVIMDEVFDLKQKNMWFRSRFVSILKRFLRAFMGDSVNRRIGTFIQHWTSAPKIAKEITRLKDEFWPNGVLADKAPERDESVRNVTQVLCKAKLLGIVSDELRHIIGSETTRRGLLRLFELLQNETLDRRFVYIIFEALLIKLFRPNDLHLVFEKLYSQSARVKEEYRRRIFEHEHFHNGVLNTQHYNESNQRPYYFNRLSVRTDDDHTNLSRSNSSGLQQRTLPRSLSKISKQ
ncbi:unnamed protein product [Rotaria socialis]|uniref:Sorting nexin-13 n=1 Tax=Rotaria socialis TaxID=392032 RepID=A0A818ERA6_9BILA|nr:unnamed protein product [Rotaria socialis]CAF3501467.1 unnamed protein product [Rotaria socialis]CAF3586917.1 unnamed protein product [Rotaria socialis]